MGLCSKLLLYLMLLPVSLVEGERLKGKLLRIFPRCKEKGWYRLHG